MSDDRRAKRRGEIARYGGVMCREALVAQALRRRIAPKLRNCVRHAPRMQVEAARWRPVGCARLCASCEGQKRSARIRPKIKICIVEKVPSTSSLEKKAEAEERRNRRASFSIGGSASARTVRPFRVCGGGDRAGVLKYRWPRRLSATKHPLPLWRRHPLEAHGNSASYLLSRYCGASTDQNGRGEAQWHVRISTMFFGMLAWHLIRQASENKLLL